MELGTPPPPALAALPLEVGAMKARFVRNPDLQRCPCCIFFGGRVSLETLLMLKRMWKHELCLECLTTMACAILAQALFWVPGTQAV